MAETIMGTPTVMNQRIRTTETEGKTPIGVRLHRRAAGMVGGPRDPVGPVAVFPTRIDRHTR
jgi:hypothetical protein